MRPAIRRRILLAAALAVCAAAGFGMYIAYSWATRPADRLAVTPTEVRFTPAGATDEPARPGRFRVLCVDHRSGHVVRSTYADVRGTVVLSAEPGGVLALEVDTNGYSRTIRKTVPGEWRFLGAYHGFALDGRECLTVFIGTPGTGADSIDE